MNAEETSTVAQVKRLYAVVIGVTETSFRFVCNGKRCQDHQTLLECGVKNGDSILLVIEQWGD